jgi:hypothetical protein
MSKKWGAPGKEARTGCAPRRAELKLKVKEVVPKENFASVQNRDWQE